PVLVCSCSPPPQPTSSPTISPSVVPSASTAMPLPPVVHSNDPLRESQTYFAGHPVEPNADHSILVEGEELHVDEGAWAARPYGTNYYASTFANCFLSRKAYLGAPEQSPHSVAGIEVV